MSSPEEIKRDLIKLSETLRSNGGGRPKYIIIDEVDTFSAEMLRDLRDAGAVALSSVVPENIQCVGPLPFKAELPRHDFKYKMCSARNEIKTRKARPWSERGRK